MQIWGLRFGQSEKPEVWGIQANFGGIPLPVLSLFWLILETMNNTVKWCQSYVQMMYQNYNLYINHEIIIQGASLTNIILSLCSLQSFVDGGQAGVCSPPVHPASGDGPARFQPHRHPGQSALLGRSRQSRVPTTALSLRDRVPTTPLSLRVKTHVGSGWVTARISGKAAYTSWVEAVLGSRQYPW